TAQFEIAQTYYESGDYPQAGKFFTRVRLLDLAPSDRARAHFMAGCAEQRAGELEAAATTLHDYLEQWPSDENVPEARYVLATTLDELNRHQEAMAVALAMLNAEHAKVASDPKRWNYWQRRTGNQLANRFFQSGNTLDALKIYSYLTVLSPDAGWRLPIVYQTALCYERLFQTDRARLPPLRPLHDLPRSSSAASEDLRRALRAGPGGEPAPAAAPQPAGPRSDRPQEAAAGPPRRRPGRPAGAADRREPRFRNARRPGQGPVPRPANHPARPRERAAAHPLQPLPRRTRSGLGRSHPAGEHAAEDLFPAFLSADFGAIRALRPWIQAAETKEGPKGARCACYYPGMTAP